MTPDGEAKMTIPRNPPGRSLRLRNKGGLAAVAGRSSVPWCWTCRVSGPMRSGAFWSNCARSGLRIHVAAG